MAPAGERLCSLLTIVLTLRSAVGSATGRNRIDRSPGGVDRWGKTVTPTPALARAISDVTL
jgi:hypothetical protein